MIVIIVICVAPRPAEPVSRAVNSLLSRKVVVKVVSQLAVLLKLQGVQFYPVRKAHLAGNDLTLWNHRCQQYDLTEPVSVIVATSLDLT